jgi:hypothetical protein
MRRKSEKSDSERFKRKHAAQSGTKRNMTVTLLSEPRDYEGSSGGAREFRMTPEEEVSGMRSARMRCAQ